MKRVLLFFCSFLCSLLVQGQSSIWQEMKKRYPDESGLYLYRNKVVTLEIKDDSLMATAEVEESILFLKDRPDNANDMRIYGSHFQEIQDVNAKTQVWEKSRYKDIPLTGLTRKRDDDSDIFFDDSYFYNLSFPVAHAGNQATWSFKERYRDARFLTTFYFQGHLPQAKGSVVVRAPQGVELKWHTMNDQNKLIHFKKYEKGAFTYYEWSMENIPAIKWEDDSPKYGYFAPHVIFHVASWKNKNGPVSLLSNLDDLHRWYYTNLQHMDEKPSEELAGVVNQLVQSGDKEMDIVRKVFYWVQDNIRYVAFEDGMRGFVPHKPSYVMEKRYGDCKDMASLIVGMLRAAGVKSYYTWIGTRDLPYRYSDVPTPIVDNHMIATYIDSQQNYFFLDGTSNHTSVTLPSSMIQGKEALVALGPTSYEVKQVPEISSKLNSNVDTVQLRIESNSLVGKGKSYLTGYQKIDASYDFNKTQAIRQKENVVDWVKKGSNKFFLDTYTIRQLEAKDLPLILDYDFRVSDYITYVGPEIYVNMNLEKTYYNQFIPAERKVSRTNDYRFVMDNHYTLEIPEGYEVEYLPPNANHDGPILTFDLSYRQSGSTIIFNSTLVNNSLLLDPQQFDEWNKAVKQLSTAYKESIILKKKSP